MFDITSGNTFDLKNIIVNRDERFKIFAHKSVTLKELEKQLYQLDNNDADWKNKVEQYKRLISEEKEKNTRYIIRYNKEYVNFDNMNTLGLFRSIVTDTKRIISFSPQKSVPIDYFEKNSSNSDIIVTELVEGTMLNMYFDSEWKIATRSNIGATNKFFTAASKNFKDMFMEAFTNSGLEFNMFSKNYSYSFVLQHPENRIVLQYDNPNIILTNVYKCSNMMIEEQDIFSNTCEWINNTNKKLIHLPQTIEGLNILNGNFTINDCQEQFNKSNIDFTIPGVVLYNRSFGIRSKIRNPNYEYVRELKGNQPKLQFQYYNLRRLNRVKEYLDFYPEDAEHFSKFRKQLHVWTHNLWQFYVSCYINKEKPLMEFPFEYRTHMFNLHKLYINELREQKQYISRKVVINFVNNLPSDHLMSSINYPIRKLHSKKNKQFDEVLL